MAVIPVQRGELRCRDPPSEHVVVVTGDGDHREDLAVLRIHRDADGLRELVFLDAFAKLAVDELLQAVVDGERNGIADGRPLERERLYLALRRVAFDLAPPVRPAQILLVDGFDPGTSE